MKSKTVFISGVVYVGAILVVVLSYTTGSFSKKDVGEVLGDMNTADEEVMAVPIETVGENQVEEAENMGISWPGEIVSLGDIEVQPQREGTIVEWNTNIGQKVFKGQVLGRLSSPPKAPELIKMLAEQAEGLAKAKGQAQATADFAKKNIAQLITLRGALQKNIEEVGSTLKDTEWARINTLTSSRPAIVQLQNVVEIKKQNVGKIMEQILHVHIQKFTTVFDPKNFRYGLLRDGLGLLDITSQSNYEMRVYDLLNALKDPQALPIEAAQNYAQAAIRLVGGSITTEGLTQADIDDFRTMVHDDQSNLLGVIKEYEEAKSDLAMRETEYKLTQLEQEKDYAGQRAEYKLTQLEQEKDYAEQMKEINEKIAMLERERQMTMAEVQASEAAYHTVARSITEGLTIVAPHTGTVSTIYKKNGDFVEPGMPVASIDTGDTTQRFVRFHIPSNLSIPEPGTILTIMRPGYPQDEKKVILIGTGTALNGNGAYVADAKFMDPVDWPVRISVRVMPQHGLITSTLIPFDAVWWDEHAQANVWLVTEEEKIRPQQIKTGRTLGDKIEVSEGLQQGNRYVAKITEGLVQGMTLKGAQIKDNQEPEKQNDEYDDGHDH